MELELESPKNDGLGNHVFSMVSAGKNNIVCEDSMIANFFFVSFLVHSLHNENEVIVEFSFEIPNEE